MKPASRPVRHSSRPAASLSNHPHHSSQKLGTLAVDRGRQTSSRPAQRHHCSRPRRSRTKGNVLVRRLSGSDTPLRSQRECHSSSLPVCCGGDASASAQGVNDAQIASVVVTARQVDIDTGKLAHATSTNADVKKCAQLMITDHTSLLIVDMCFTDDRR
jgi:hypothetical protein